MNSAVTKPTQMKMIKGSGGDLDYLAIARKGKIVLGIKLIRLGPGRIVNTLQVAIRVRSAWAGTMFDDEDAKLGIITNLSDAKLTPDKAWDIPWMSVDSVRASTVTDISFPGLNDPQTLFPNLLENKKLAREIVDGLVKLIGDEKYLIIGKRVIRDWLHEKFDKQFTKVLEHFKTQAAVVEQETQALGTFGVSADVLKKLHDKVSTKGSEVEDVEEATDVDSDYDEDGNLKPGTDN